MWQGTLCSYWSTAVSEQGSAGTGLCIYALPAFCSKPHLATSQHSGMDVTRGERLTEGAREVSFTQSIVAVCVPLEATPIKAPGYVEDWRTVYLCAHFLFCWFSLPTPWASGTWRQRSGLACSVPHFYRCSGIPLTLSQKIPSSQVPSTEGASLLTIMTTTLKSRLDKWSERKPDSAGRDRKVNMVTISSYTLPLTLQSFWQREGLHPVVHTEQGQVLRVSYCEQQW